jgi:hypothetical protein
MIVNTRVVVAAGAITVLKTDYAVIVNQTVPTANVVNLPAAPVLGELHLIKDGSGTAAADNLTVTPAAGTIDGLATFVMNTNYSAKFFLYNGTEWSVI